MWSAGFCDGRTCFDCGGAALAIAQLLNLGLRKLAVERHVRSANQVLLGG